MLLTSVRSVFVGCIWFIFLPPKASFMLRFPFRFRNSVVGASRSRWTCRWPCMAGMGLRALSALLGSHVQLVLLCTFKKHVDTSSVTCRLFVWVCSSHYMRACQGSAWRAIASWKFEERQPISTVLAKNISKAERRIHPNASNSRQTMEQEQV